MFSELSKHKLTLLQRNHSCILFRVKSCIAPHLGEQNNKLRGGQIQIQSCSEQISK